MGTKLYTVIFDSRLINEKKIAQSILEYTKNIVIDSFQGKKEELPEKIPAVTGSWFLEFSKPHPKYHMQMILNHRIEEIGRYLIPIEDLAQHLSKTIKNIPFIYLKYNSVVSTGSCTVYVNGEVFRKSKSKEGDEAKNISPIFEKYFNIPYKNNRAWKIINAWFSDCYYYGQYNTSSYEWSKYIIERKIENQNEQFFKDFISKENEALQLFLKDPNITENEWNKQKDMKIPYLTIKNTYKHYIHAMNKTFLSKMFSLTEGNLFAKNGVFFLNEVKEITPKEWFEAQDNAKDDLERRKDEKFGKRPESYSLTKEEIETLSYEEQKKEAYRRREIAIKRGDDNGYGNSKYAWGIKIISHLKKGDYIDTPNGIGRIKFINLVPDKDLKTYTEEANIYIKVQNGQGYQFDIVKNLDLYKVIDSLDVPENYIVPDSYM